MASTKGRVLQWLGGWVLAEGRVEAVREVDRNFLVLRVRAPLAAGPGDKIQVLLPEQDVRTYTPIPEDEPDVFSLVVLRRGDTPAGRWAASVAVGDTLRFVGPQRSLSLPDGPVGLIGDATSVAVAAAYARRRPTVAAFVTDVDLTGVLAAVGLAGSPVFSGLNAVERAVEAVTGPSAIGVTGGGELVQQARTALRARGVNPRVKAYWVAGRPGLD